MFYNFLEKFKMAAIFSRDKHFSKIVIVYLQRYPVGQKFHRNRSISHSLCALQFLRKIRKFKMATIFGETKISGKLGWLLCRNTLWALYLARFSRYKHFCVLQFLRKIGKIKMAAIFSKNVLVNLQRYLIGQIFHT